MKGNGYFLTVALLLILLLLLALFLLVGKRLIERLFLGGLG